MLFRSFLPWPTYRPDVTRVRIAVRFDPEQGYPLYASETRLTLDTSAPGGGNRAAAWSNQPMPGAQPAGGFSPHGGPSPAGGPGLGVMTGGTGPQPTGPAAPAMPAAPPGVLLPAPPGYGSLPLAPPGMFPPAVPAPAGPGGIPHGLPPLVIVGSQGR